MKTTKIFVRLPGAMSEALTRCVNAEKASRADIVRNALEAYAAGVTSIDPQTLLHLYYPRRTRGMNNKLTTYELAVRVPVQLARTLQDRAEERGVPESVWMREAIYAYLAQNGFLSPGTEMGSDTMFPG